jgi:hypothetical protein
LYGGFTSPRKNGLNGTIPAFTNKRFGSLAISEAEGTTVWESFNEFFDSKKSSHRERMSAESITTP